MPTPNGWRPPATPPANWARHAPELASAEGAVSDDNLIMANRFADESRAEAELASAKTGEAKASAINAEMKRSTGTLVEEMKRGTGEKP